MTDTLEGLAGSRMLHLKQDMAYLRSRLQACTEEAEKKALRRELMEKETYYNILADRQRLS